MKYSRAELADPSTRAPALTGGSCSGFRPTGAMEGVTILPVGLHKPVYGYQALGDGINRQEKTFKSHGAEQRRTVGGNEAGCRDFVAVQNQPRFRDGPNVSLSAGDHDALGARGLQFEPFRQRARHDAQSGAGVDKELNFFDTPGRTRQLSFDMEKSHLSYHFKNLPYCSSDTEQRNSPCCIEEREEGPRRSLERITP